MESETVTKLMNDGWEQSHSLTSAGGVFERREGEPLIVAAFDADGHELKRESFDDAGIRDGSAMRTVETFYQQLRG